MNRTVSGLIAALALLAPSVSRADFHIRSPYETGYGELEIEHNGSSVFDRRQDQKNASSYTIEIGTGLTPWWHTEVEFGFERGAGNNQPTLLNALVWENMLQLTEPGAAFFDTGLYIEYAQSLGRGANAGPNEFTIGPVIGKEIGRTVHTVNLFVTRQLGPGQTTQGLEFSYAWQSKWNLWAPLSPAIEVYGNAGVLGSVPKLNQQELLIGPVAVGALRFDQLGLGTAGKVKYEAGWLFGTTSASAHGALRWRLELEIPF
jgi:hypothetical protein